MRKENKLTLSEWAKMWLGMKSEMVKSNTYEATYRNSVDNHILPEFGDRLLDDIKPIELQVFINRKNKVYSEFMVKKMKSCLCQMYDEAVYNGYCKVNPCLHLKIPRRKFDLSDIEETDNRIYSVEQMELIKEYAYTHRFGYEVILLIDTGMRRGELLGLPWKYVDLQNKVIYIRQAVALVKDSNNILTTEIGYPKNKTSVRDIPISSELSEILANEKAKNKGELVVTSSKGTVCNPRTWKRRHYDVFMADMQKFYQEQEISIPIYTPHRLRHSRTSAWVNADLNLFAIAKTLGHSDLEMLERIYAHSDVEKTRKLLKIT